MVTVFRTLAVVVLLLALAVPAPGGAQNFGAPDDRHFALDWQPGERRGRPILVGYVANTSGYIFDNVRLRVEVLDATGRVTATTVGYVIGDLGPSTRRLFEVHVPQASTYRVSVLSYDRIESRSFQ
jgi:hypothetical protein